MDKLCLFCRKSRPKCVGRPKEDVSYDLWEPIALGHPGGTCCGCSPQHCFAVEELLWALEPKAAFGPVKSAKGPSTVHSAHLRGIC